MPKNNLLISKVHNLFDQSPLGLLANLINGAIVLYLFKNMVPFSELLIWYYALCIVVMIRFGLVSYYKRKKQSLGINLAKKLDHYYFGATLLSAAIWGSLAIFFFVSSIPHQVFIAFILAGMSAGASSIYVADNKYSFSYILLSVLPIAVLFLLGEEVIQTAMGSLALSTLYS